LNVLEGVPQATISKSALENCASIIDLLSEATGNAIFSSKGEARKMIQGGGVSINKSKVEDGNAKPTYTLLHGKYLLAQKGKKNYYLVIVK
jgi:tyrosyl-tRNA synthetase